MKKDLEFLKSLEQQLYSAYHDDFIRNTYRSEVNELITILNKYHYTNEIFNQNCSSCMISLYKQCYKLMIELEQNIKDDELVSNLADSIVKNIETEKKVVKNEKKSKK